MNDDPVEIADISKDGLPLHDVRFVWQLEITPNEGRPFYVDSASADDAIRHWAEQCRLPPGRRLLFIRRRWKAHGFSRSWAVEALVCCRSETYLGEWKSPEENSP